MTQKEQAFAYWRPRCGSGTEAARRAGFKGNDASLASVASRLSRKVNVAQAIAKEMERHLEAEGLTTKTVLDTLLRAIKGAESEQNWSVMIKGSEVLLRYLKEQALYEATGAQENQGPKAIVLPIADFREPIVDGDGLKD